MARAAALLLSLAMVLALAACGAQEDGTGGKGSAGDRVQEDIDNAVDNMKDDVEDMVEDGKVLEKDR